MIYHNADNLSAKYSLTPHISLSSLTVLNFICKNPPNCQFSLVSHQDLALTLPDGQPQPSPQRLHHGPLADDQCEDGDSNEPAGDVEEHLEEAGPTQETPGDVGADELKYPPDSCTRPNIQNSREMYVSSPVKQNNFTILRNSFLRAVASGASSWFILNRSSGS